MPVFTHYSYYNYQLTLRVNPHVPYPQCIAGSRPPVHGPAAPAIKSRLNAVLWPIVHSFVPALAKHGAPLEAASSHAHSFGAVLAITRSHLGYPKHVSKLIHQVKVVLYSAGQQKHLKLHWGSLARLGEGKKPDPLSAGPRGSWLN